MNLSQQTAAIIVAHPDDEIIWCGGLVLRYPEWNWTILSLSRADDPDRCAKFWSVCCSLGVRGHMGHLDDSNPLKPINCAAEIGDRVLDNLGGVPWDLCITHGANGEYGHPRHIEVHAQVMKLVRDCLLNCEELWTFAYCRDPCTHHCEAASDADIVVDLTEDELREKMRIIQDVYGYGPESFEMKACTSPEAFRRLRSPMEGLEL